jgi:hypothetical protein
MSLGSLSICDELNMKTQSDFSQAEIKLVGATQSTILDTIHKFVTENNLVHSNNRQKSISHNHPEWECGNWDEYLEHYLMKQEKTTYRIHFYWKGCGSGFVLNFYKRNSTV